MPVPVDCRDDLADALGRDVAVVDRDGEALVLDAYSRDVLQASPSSAAARSRTGTAAAAASLWWCLPSGPISSKPWLPAYQMSGHADAVADVRQIAAAQDGDGAQRRQVLQRLGRAVDERGRIGIRDDLGQGAVEVEAHERLPAADDADQLTVGVQRVRQLRHPLVAGAHGDVGEVGDHDIGTVTLEFVGVSGPVDADDEREAAVACPLTPACASSMTTDRSGTVPSLSTAWSKAGSGWPGSRGPRRPRRRHGR